MRNLVLLFAVLAAGCATTLEATSEGGKIKHNPQPLNESRIQYEADQQCARYGKKAVLGETTMWPEMITYYKCVE